MNGSDDDGQHDLDQSEIDRALADEGLLFEDEEEEPEEPPVSFWRSARDAARGLVALLVLSIAVLMLYIIGGVFVGLLAWAAPAILAITAAIVLARYLSRER